MDMHWLGKRLMLLQMLRRRSMHGPCFANEIVPGQYPLLNYLSRHPDATQQELANMLFVSPASVAQSTKRLQKAGLLEKASDPENLRKNRLRVTPAGQDAVDSVREAIDTLDKRLFEGFAESELETLSAMLDRLIRNLATEEDLAMLQAMHERGDPPHGALFSPPMCGKDVLGHPRRESPHKQTAIKESELKG